MPRTDAALDPDFRSPPFDQFRGIQRLAKDRRGHVSVEYARHQLYVGIDKQSRDSVLIKITSRPGITYQHNLENEIASLLKVNQSIPESPYFPEIRAHGKLRDGRVYMVSSFFYEFPLANAIDTEPVPGKTVAYVRTGLEIARALGELHGLGIFHVDLNPMNILLRLEHRRPIVRIIDFESSYDSERHAAGVFYNPPNTPGYSAPEISSHPPDARADVFSLGAVLYTMLLGYKWRREVEAGQALSGDRPLDRDLEGILLKAIDQQPEHRYPSIEEFQASLAAYLEGIWPGRKSAGWT